MTDAKADPWNAFNSMLAHVRNQEHQGAADAIEYGGYLSARRRDLIDLAYAQNEMTFALSSAIVAIRSNDQELRIEAFQNLIVAIEGQQRFFTAFLVRMLGRDADADVLATKGHSGG